MANVTVCLREARPGYAQGGRVAAQKTAKAGRFGDHLIVHMNSDEYKELCDRWGPPTFNPKTGQPEFFLSGLTKFFSKNPILGALATAAGTAFLGPLAGGLLGSVGIPASLSGILGSGLVGAGLGGIAGGGKGALLGGLGGALAGPYLSNAVSGMTGISGLGGQQGIGDLFNNTFGGSTAAQALGAGEGDTAYTQGGLSPAALAAQQSGTNYAAQNAAAGFGGGVVTPGSQLAGAATGGAGTASGPGLAGLGGSLGSLAPLLLVGALAMGTRATGGPTQPGNTPPANFGQPIGGGSQGARLQPVPFDRKYQGYSGNYYTYGQEGPEANMFSRNQLPGDVSSTGTAAGKPPTAKRGGYLADISRGKRLKRAKGGPVPIHDGRSDVVHADLSPDEYVVDAETLALLGNGSPRAGAQRMDQMRAAIREHKGPALARGKISPDAKPPLAYLKKARGGAIEAVPRHLAGPLSDDPQESIQRGLQLDYRIRNMLQQRQQPAAPAGLTVPGMPWAPMTDPSLWIRPQP